MEWGNKNGKKLLHGVASLHFCRTRYTCCSCAVEWSSNLKKSAKFIFFVKLSVDTFILDGNDVLKWQRNFARFRKFMVDIWNNYATLSYGKQMGFLVRAKKKFVGLPKLYRKISFIEKWGGKTRGWRQNHFGFLNFYPEEEKTIKIYEAEVFPN